MPTPLQSSGQITFTEIFAEFGTPPNNNLGAYRVNQSIAGKNWVLDTGVPSSGPIKFSDFYGKRLNIVIDSGTGSDEFNATLASYWTNTNKTKTCVGGFKSHQSSLATQGNKKYHVVLRRDYGGATTVNTSVKSGDWSVTSGGILNVYVSTGSTVYGRGGNGGAGSGDDGGGGGFGAPGRNAIGFSYSSNLIVDGGIIAGAGGGGGGKGGYWDTPNDPLEWHAGGGGGGGGLGNPGGTGGVSNLSRSGGVNQRGQSGVNGSKASGGKGGNGRAHPSPGRGGGGGGGWSTTTRGAAGTPSGSAGGIDGRGGNGGSSGTNRGPAGRAIVANSGVTITVTNNGTITPSATPQTGTFT